MSKSPSPVDLNLNGASIIEGVAVGVTLGDAAGMLEYLQEAVAAHERFAKGTPQNVETLKPEDNNGVTEASFEIARVLSNHLIVSLRFSWMFNEDEEESDIMCTVCMNSMNDGRGEFSQDWSTIGEMEDCVRLGYKDSMEYFLTRCFDQAIDYQVEMLWRAGIIDMTPDGQGIGNTTARQIAQSSWFLR